MDNGTIDFCLMLQSESVCERVYSRLLIDSVCVYRSVSWRKQTQSNFLWFELITLLDSAYKAAVGTINIFTGQGLDSPYIVGLKDHTHFVTSWVSLHFVQGTLSRLVLGKLFYSNNLCRKLVLKLWKSFLLKVIHPYHVERSIHFFEKGWGKDVRIWVDVFLCFLKLEAYQTGIPPGKN